MKRAKNAGRCLLVTHMKKIRDNNGVGFEWNFFETKFVLYEE